MKRKNNYLSIIVFAVLCVILAASVSIVVIAYINKMFQYQYEKYTDLEYTILEKPLDKKYMLDDFDILYNTIIENQMLEERNVSKYGFRFAERYDEYKALVEACENEYEFFAVMNGLLNEVPGCHTQLLWPDYVDNAPNIFYGSFNFAAYQYPDERMYEAANVMNNKISEFVSDKYDMKIMTFNYIDGIYELNRRGGTTMDIPDGYCRIELINGNEPADYISEELFSQKLKYDKMNQSLYRDLIIFNDTYGNKCTLTLKYDNGETYEVEVYGGVKGEIASIYALSNSLSETEENASSNEQGEEKSNDYLITENEFIGDYTYSYLDGNTLYTNHYTFDSGIDEKKAYAEFIKACDYDNVIIDIRDNTGGSISTFSDFVYQFYFSENKTEDIILFGKINNETNMAVNDFEHHTPNNGIYYEYEKIRYGKSREKIYKINIKQNYRGNMEDKNIYVLISGTTASAADSAAHFMKENTDAVIIGENTAGEGYSSYVFKTLPDSGLVMSYTPFFPEPIAENNEYSIIGTTPDIYSALSIDMYRKKIDMSLKGEKTDLYKNRLKWDNVLIETLDIIKENQKNNPAE